MSKMALLVFRKQLFTLWPGPLFIIRLLTCFQSTFHIRYCHFLLSAAIKYFIALQLIHLQTTTEGESEESTTPQVLTFTTQMSRPASKSSPSSSQSSLLWSGDDNGARRNHGRCYWRHHCRDRHRRHRPRGILLTIFLYLNCSFHKIWHITWQWLNKIFHIFLTTRHFFFLQNTI